jgi:hypothetical protein
MPRFLLPILLIATAHLAALEGDPRPTVLILGERNSEPFGAAPSWIDIVRSSHRDWLVIGDVDANRGIPQLTERLPAIAAAARRADLVVVFVGTFHAKDAAWKLADAAALAPAAQALLAAIPQQPALAKAAVVVVTPLPVIDKRLDQWQKKDFSEGEARCTAIAAMLRTAAAGAKATVIDAHAWALADADDRGPGRIMGSLGSMIRDWGHPILAAWLDAQLTPLVPAPPDAAAFAAWKAERAADVRIDAILSATSDGVVAHGPALPRTAGDKGAVLFTVPAGALAGAVFDVVLTADGDHGLAVYPGSETPKPVLKVATAGGEVAINASKSDWQMIDEADPAVAQPSNRFRFNSGKMRNLGVVRGGAGTRRWVLMRFPLDALAGKGATGAMMSVPTSANLDNADGPLDAGLSAHVVLGPDTAWDQANATWKTRDGSAGWTGGTVRTAERRSQLQAFLAGNPPTAAAARATALLAAP